METARRVAVDPIHIGCGVLLFGMGMRDLDKTPMESAKSIWKESALTLDSVWNSPFGAINEANESMNPSKVHIKPC